MAVKTANQNGQDAQEQLAQAGALLEKNKNTIIAVVAGIVLVVAAAFGYNYYQTSQNEQATAAMFKGQQYFAADNYETALNGDGQGYTGFLKVADEFGGSKAGNLARLYAGLCYAQLGKYQEAADMLEDFDHADDVMVTPAAIGALGNCYAQLDQKEKAAKTLVKAAKRADNNTLSPIYLMQAGELYEALGQKDDALDCYEQIKEKYINSMQFGEIDKYIERVTE